MFAKMRLSESNSEEATLEALQGKRFRCAAEPGCSTGVLTEKLALLAEKVVACDISEEAIAEAKLRCRHLTNISFSVAPMMCEVSPGSFDLLVLSEIGYFFPASKLARLVQDLIWRSSPDGVLLAVHSLAQSEDHLLSGDQVHQIIRQLQGITHEYGERHPEFRLDRWRRVQKLI